MTALTFSKMQALGNDFVVINALSDTFNFSTQQLRFIADRKYGIGCDQILLLERAQSQFHDFYYRIFNANGSEVGQCGNGARCIMRFILDHKLCEKSSVHLQTKTCTISLEYKPQTDLITVGMPEPEFWPQQSYQLSIPGIETVQCQVLSLGNPHAVIIAEQYFTSLDSIDEQVAHALSIHDIFPHQANINFVDIIDRNHLKLRTFERGVGFTLACGSGACAAVAALRQQNIVNQTVKVQMPGGQVEVEWPGKDQQLYLTGSANTVFTGEITIPSNLEEYFS